MSWAPEVIADETGKWLPNRLRFATQQECNLYGYDLSLRWTAVRDTRSVQSDDPVNSRFVGGKLEHLDPSP